MHSGFQQQPGSDTHAHPTATAAQLKSPWKGQPPAPNYRRPKSSPHQLFICLWPAEQPTTKPIRIPFLFPSFRPKKKKSDTKLDLGEKQFFSDNLYFYVYLKSTSVTITKHCLKLGLCCICNSGGLAITCSSSILH